MLTLLFFGVSNILIFYILFELILFPIILLIYFHGSQPEKIGSIYYAVIYTGGFSLPFLWQLMKLEGWIVDCYISPFAYMFFIGLFMVKIPVYGLHFWLPKAHVEAPTSARILLAGVILKVGLFGLLMSISLFNTYSVFSFWGSLFGCMFAPLLASFSSEVKLTVAYSSVTHMNLGVYAANLFSRVSVSGNYLLSISHGFISALMFQLGGKLYELNGSRIIFHLGSIGWVSGLTLCAVLVIFLGNSGVPPLISFWGELLLFNPVLVFSVLCLIILMATFMFRFYYSLYLVCHLIKRGVISLIPVFLFVSQGLGSVLLLNFLIYEI